MADGRIQYEVEVDSSGAVKGLKDVETQAGKTGEKSSKSFDRLVTAALAAEAAIAGFAIKGGLEFNAQLEGYQTSFEVMTGDAEYAYELVDRLKTQAASTPFDLTQLAKTTQLMMNYGMEGDKAVDMMSRLGDIAQGDAQKLDSVSLAFSQMSSLGKVQLQDIKQMINGGFNPLQEIAEHTGESMESLYDRISKGTMSVNEITDSIMRSTSVGGKYFDSMDKQSQTLKGRWNTLKDTVREATGNMTKGLSDTLANDVLPAAIDKVRWLGENFEKLVPAIAAVTTAMITMKLAANFDNIVSSVKAIITFLTSSAGIWGLIIAAVGAAVALCTALAIEVNKPTESFQQWKAEIDKVNSALETVQSELDSIPDYMNTTGKSIESTTQQATDYINRLAELEEKSELTAEEQDEWNNILQALSGIIPGITGLIDDETGSIEGGTQALRDYLAEWQKTQYIQAMGETMTQAIKTQMDAVEARTRAYEVYQGVQAEHIRLGQEEQVMLDAINEEFGLNCTSLEEANDALSAWSGGLDENAEKASDYQRDIQGLTKEIQDNDKALGMATDTLNEANKKVDEATGKVNTITSAQDKIQRGEGDLATVWQECIEDMVGAQDDLNTATADGASEIEGVTAEMASLTRRNYDEGLVKALHDAGVNSHAELVWLTQQSDEQIKSWNDLFKKDAKAAVEQISNAFKNSDAGKKAAELGKNVETSFKPDLYSSGANAVDGAISGMEAKRGRLREKAASLASTVKSAFNVRLDVKSPSKVMAESGRYVVEGVMVGMENERRDLAREAELMAATVQDAFHVDTSGIQNFGSIQAIQQTEMVSQMAAQVNSAPINVHMDIDGREFATATALPMSYALETLRLAEVRG